MLVNLHVDIEPQKTYRPGYPVEKRGIYYLARQLSAQLSLVTDNTDYDGLEKCYSIWICRDDEGYELLRFLNTIMYPHEGDFLDKMSEYIDFSANEELWKEVAHVTGLGECVFRDGLEEGIEKGIRAMILDNLEEKVPEERILRKLQKHFALTSERAEKYYRQFALDES